MNGFDTFREEAKFISNRFPGLSLSDKDGKPVVHGKLSLIDKDGVLHTTYSIEIHAVEEYPNRFPYVFETGDRIPRNIDWHIFETDGHCCLKNLPEEILICKEKLNLDKFIIEEVTPYFFNQLYREKHGYFLQERSHGLIGELEFFFDLFRTADLLKVYKMLYVIKQRLEPTRTEKCFCGSKEKYRRCHRDAYRIASRFSDHELSYFIRKLIESDIFKHLHPFQALQISQGKFFVH